MSNNFHSTSIVDENADIVISLLNQLGIKKCNLVGWSMGSAVALSIARKKKKSHKQDGFNNTV